jgi:hypothetical protein
MVVAPSRDHPGPTRPVTSVLGRFETEKPCRARVQFVSCAPSSGHCGQSACHLSRHYLRDGYTCFHWFAARGRCRIAPTVFLLSPTRRPINRLAQTSLWHLEDLRRLVVRWTLSWLAAEPFTAGLRGDDARFDALVPRIVELENRRLQDPRFAGTRAGDTLPCMAPGRLSDHDRRVLMLDRVEFGFEHFGSEHLHRRAALLAIGRTSLSRCCGAWRASCHDGVAARAAGKQNAPRPGPADDCRTCDGLRLQCRASGCGRPSSWGAAASNEYSGEEEVQ